MSISRREMSVSRCEMKKWACSFLFHSLFFTVLRRTFWQFSVGFFFSFYLLLWGLSLYIQVSQAQLSGVQECRSDASLRSVDDSDACMVSFVYHSQSNCLHSCLLHSCYFSTCESWVISKKPWAQEMREKRKKSPLHFQYPPKNPTFAPQNRCCLCSSMDRTALS